MYITNTSFILDHHLCSYMYFRTRTLRWQINHAYTNEVSALDFGMRSHLKSYRNNLWVIIDLYDI